MNPQAKDGWGDYKLPVNPVSVPNPAFIGLAVLGVICLGLAAFYLSMADSVGWVLIAVGLFLFSAASGVTLSLRTAGVLAAIAVVLLILSLVTSLPV